MNAGFFARLGAYMIDKLIIGVGLLGIKIAVGISALINSENVVVKDIFFQYSLADIVFYLLGTLYFILLTYKTGNTIGKKAFHLKVQSVEDRKMTFFEVAFRETIGRFLSSIACIGYIFIIANENKRALHDLLSDTEVVYYHGEKETVEIPTVNRAEEPTIPMPAEETVFEEINVEQETEKKFSWEPVEIVQSSVETEEQPYTEE